MIAGYNDPIKIQLNYDNDGSPISVEMQPETHIVVNGKITLLQIPDKFYRVQIDGLTELYEYDNSAMQSDNYRVNYETGIVMVGSGSMEGQTVTVNKYWGRGITLTPATRIYTRLDDFGNVIATLEDSLDNIDTIYNAVNSLDSTISNANQTKQDLESDISTGENLNEDLEITITEGNQLNTVLSPLVDDANTSKTNLESTISNAIVVNSNLDLSISDGETLKIGLDESIVSANNINNTLSNETDGTIKLATDINDELVLNTNTATTKNTALEQTIGLSNTSKSELEISISDAESIQYQIDNKVSEIETSNPFVEKFIATEGQQEFILTQGQYKDYPMMRVCVQGISIDPIDDFILVDDTEQNKIFINEPLPLGTEVSVNVLETLPVDIGGTIIP